MVVSIQIRHLLSLPGMRETLALLEAERPQESGVVNVQMTVTQEVFLHGLMTRASVALMLVTCFFESARRHS